MLQSRRRRHHNSSSYVESGKTRSLLKIMSIFVFAVLIVWGAMVAFRALSPAVHGRNVATMLSIGDRGRVDVKLGGENVMQRAESGLRLYDGDVVLTDGGASATLHFFDGTNVQLDGNSEVVLKEAVVGEEKSALSLAVSRGSVFVHSGTGVNVLRTIEAALARYDVPPNTMAILGRSLFVFSTSGPGVQADIHISSRTSSPVIVGEGQQLLLDEISVKSIKEDGLDPYDLRGVLDDQILSSGLYLSAIEKKDVPEEPEAPDVLEGEEGEALILEEPEDGAVLKGSAVLVRGRVGSRVVSVNVNGYPAELADGEFRKEIALPDDENFSVDVQAEDRDGLLVAEKSILLSHDIRPPDAPVITYPGGSGDTIQINDDSFEIVGTASPDTTGVIVNGYQLQKYRPGQEWRYLVDAKLGNIRIGDNTFEVVAVDRAGNRSETARMVIVWKAQPLVESVDEEVRDAGEYLAQGTLRIIAPTSDGSTFVTSEREVLIEGETSPDTHSLSINGFTLTLYEPGKITWNYIAKNEFGNYKVGVNRFTIVARDGEGRILDVVRYLVERR